MYSPDNILKQEPAYIVAVVQAVLAMFVVAGVVDLSTEAVAGILAGVGAVLNAFYVRSVVSTASTVRREQQAAYDRGVAQ